MVFIISFQQFNMLTGGSGSQNHLHIVLEKQLLSQVVNVLLRITVGASGTEMLVLLG